MSSNTFRTWVLLSSLQILGIGWCYSQGSNQKFIRLTTNMGLSNGHITSILKDRKGFMWFTTDEGLNKYDGYKFTVYKHDPEDSTSISSNYVRQTFEDHAGNLWVGTVVGLDKFDREKNTFTHYCPGALNTMVRTIFEDSKNRIWAGTSNGLFLLNTRNGTCRHFQREEKNSNSLSNNLIYQVIEDNDGNLWITTKDGLTRFNPQIHQFVRYAHDANNSKSLAGNWVKSIYKDTKGRLWVGVIGHGLALYNPKENSFTHFKNDPSNPNTLCGNVILSLIEGKDGKLWIGSENGGLCTFDYEKNAFVSFHYDPLDNTSLSNNSIHSLFCDDIGNIWVGTYSGGINFIPKFGDKFTHYKQNPFKKNSLSSNLITSITGDNNGNIWLGTDGGGLNRFDLKTKTFTYFKKDSLNKNSLSSDYILSLTNYGESVAIGYHKEGLDFFDKKTSKSAHIISVSNSQNISNLSVEMVFKDRKGDLWVSIDRPDTLYFYDLKTKSIQKLPRYFDKQEHNNAGIISSFGEDNDGNLFLGSNMGLEQFNLAKNLSIHYEHDSQNKHSLSHNNIRSILHDSKGNLWFGSGGGLNLFDKKTQSFKAYTEKDGLNNNSIYGIQEDNQGSLWFSSNKGLSRFNPVTKKCRNYDVSDGLQDNSFKPNAYYKAANGEMYYGGVNGFNVFHPDSIKDNTFIPPVVITDFHIFNKPVKIGGNSPLKKHISETKEITLSYEQSVFTFEFAALNYTLPEKNLYSYKLEGFDKEWNPVANKRTATYTNLNPGKYIFRVKGSNNDGIWNDKDTWIQITITPPYWKTWWFKSLMILMVIGILGTWYKMRIKTIQKQKEKLEKQVTERTAEILMQKEEIQAQAENLQHANEEIKGLYGEITESIRAAQAIQQSILPTESFIKKHIPEHFILYKPKDVVSGDFYWIDETDNKIVIAAVDCTGHGVSGAFMSINGHHLLNQSIYPYKDLKASEILDRLNAGIVKGFHQDDDNSESMEGMDVAICILDKDKKKMQYSGANNPLYILRGEEIIQIKANKFPIGMIIKGYFNSYTNHEVELQKGDSVFIFSDGYADQLGQESAKEKFSYSRFRELLIKIKDLPMAQQLIALDESFQKWKGSNEQLDDVLVIGFKI